MSTANLNSQKFKLPKLDPGISVKDHLYIKTFTGGIASLRRDGVVAAEESRPTSGLSKEPLLKLPIPKNKISPEPLTRKQKQKLREATSDPNWFGMPKPVMTPELKRDLHILKSRNVLDPKRFYKKEDSKVLPKYFQLGTIIEGPTEFYSSRLTRKERRQTIIEEVMADEHAKAYYKRKFLDIQEEKDIQAEDIQELLKKITLNFIRNILNFPIGLPKIAIHPNDWIKKLHFLIRDFSESLYKNLCYKSEIFNPPGKRGKLPLGLDINVILLAYQKGEKILPDPSDCAQLAQRK
ncbi:hypothetical protein G9A89_009542 [Geosiphon pyriformis]|nr:hypothetical protein G9A89_009542 [Geosiphon pyriformis]